MSPTPFRCLAMLVALLGAAPVLIAGADNVSATMVTSEVLVQDGVADATFTIEVINGGATAATNVRVVFAEGDEVVVGEVAPGGARASESQRRAIDVSELPTLNVPVSATLKYSQAGSDVESSVTLILRIR